MKRFKDLKYKLFDLYNDIDNLAEKMGDYRYDNYFNEYKEKVFNFYKLLDNNKTTYRILTWDKDKLLKHAVLLENKYKFDFKKYEDDRFYILEYVFLNDFIIRSCKKINFSNEI